MTNRAKAQRALERYLRALDLKEAAQEELGQAWNEAITGSSPVGQCFVGQWEETYGGILEKKLYVGGPGIVDLENYDEGVKFCLITAEWSAKEGETEPCIEITED
jgi:hypothetical protein